jgi:hypothetical protein
MSAVAKTPSLLHGIGTAFALSVLGGALGFAVAQLAGAETAWRVLAPLLGLLYVLYLFRRSRPRVGRLATLAVWGLVSTAAWLTLPALLPYVAVHAAMIWLIRSLYFYAGALPALADLGLTTSALALGGWAAARSGSAFLALWSFFLVQAFFVFIPVSFRRSAGSIVPAAATEEDDVFVRAQRSADAALRRLSSIG